jgi:hypothetical protein
MGTAGREIVNAYNILVGVLEGKKCLARSSYRRG